MKPLYPTFRAALLCSAILLATPAFAQSAPVPEAESEAGADGDTIVVTGQRRAQYEATAEKREAFAVMDAISADDIGKLPDHNTAAALRRIPGLSVQEDQGEPRFPVLRGLQSTYNRTTVDGALVAGVDSGGRTVPLDIVPSVMAGRIEVIKTVTPENDANAVGGIINITTRSAFDAGRPFFNGIASYGIYEQHGEVRNSKPSYRLAFAAGTTFGADDEWGLVIGASQEQLDYDIPQIEVASPSVREYTAAGAPVDSGAATGNGIQVPTQHRLFWYNNTKQRTGGNVKLEWRPSDTFRWELSGVVARTEDDEERIEYRMEPIGNVANQTQTSGQFARGRIIVQLNQPITRRLVALGRTAFAWDGGEQWKLDGDAVFSLGRMRVPNESIEFRTRDADATRYAFSYDTSDFYPVFTPANAAAAVNPQNFYLQQQRSNLEKSLEKSGQFRLNFTYGDDSIDGGIKLKTGAVLRLTSRKNEVERTDYKAASGFTYTLDKVVTAGPSEAIRDRFYIPIRIDAQAFPAFYQANQSRFTTTVASKAGDYKVNEDVYAGYVQGSTRIGNVTLLGGLRYERTEVSSDAYRTLGSTLTQISTDGSYGNWLPSAHIRWDVTDRVVVRGAYTNTIGRPDYSSIAASETLSFDGSQPTLSRGNPSLKPRESRGFDLSFEFYPKDGVISAALFHKKIKNEIFTLSNVETIDVGRGPESVLVSEPRNAETATIKGLELNLQQALTFLPDPFDGLGVSANATFLDTRFTFLTTAGPRVTGLFLQPDTVWNASVYYQKGKFEGRLSYNYIGGFLETINDTIPNADQYWKSRGTLDANISYRVTSNITLYAEGQNLNNQGRRELVGPGRTYLQESAEYGRTFWFGVAANF
ncbi:MULTISPECIES: TonB-dependent receptor [Sphingobium]|uniref:TonB-dependent receptor n=1 Tax=Sphingobium TaxID=165695 RepID=UPI0015ECBD48|nr:MULTISPECIES: TonB-dependent receptor [Sphingobium]MCW2362964.1 TonB-dependent receptor [Sphingobium sp. B10D3B]MCW2400356.1 TonB-dependent receptor [Sphingobium sp. B10D7B]MCW2407334.1 TonB-dependent receptor [Sphingobium xanthum]